MIVKVKLLDGGVIPTHQTDGASGMDLHSAETVSIPPGKTVMVRCGIAMEVPDGYECQVRPRSSMSKKGLVVAFGTIDSDYRGEIGATITNTNQMGDKEIWKGDRIAQIVMAPVERAALMQVDELSETKRGGGGFGSTGR